MKKQKVKFTLENGTNVKSNISGFKGMITSRSDHLNGCNRYFVNPPVDKDGKLPEGYWFDEAELVKLEEPTLKPQNQERGGFSSSIK